MADTDLNLSSISSISKFEMPMSLPWHPSSTIRLGALFHSDRANEEDPWAKETLFTQSSLESIPVHYRSDEGARSFFKSSVSSTSSQFEDHMSIWLGVSLGCPILGASVSGQYDRHVINNRRVSISYYVTARLLNLARQQNHLFAQVTGVVLFLSQNPRP